MKIPILKKIKYGKLVFGEESQRTFVERQRAIGYNKAVKDMLKLNTAEDKSPICCNHANEVPMHCTCPSNCYCKENLCQPFVDCQDE